MSWDMPACLDDAAAAALTVTVSLILRFVSLAALFSENGFLKVFSIDDKGQRAPPAAGIANLSQIGRLV